MTTAHDIELARRLRDNHRHTAIGQWGWTLFAYAGMAFFYSPAFHWLTVVLGIVLLVMPVISTIRALHYHQKLRRQEREADETLAATQDFIRSLEKGPHPLDRNSP